MDSGACPGLDPGFAGVTTFYQFLNPYEQGDTQIIKIFFSNSTAMRYAIFRITRWL